MRQNILVLNSNLIITTFYFSEEIKVDESKLFTNRKPEASLIAASKTPVIFDV